MKKLDFSDLASWCAVSGYRLRDWMPSLATPIERLDLNLPNSPHALTDLVDDLVNIDTTPIQRLVWIRDWTIWNERSQEIGLHHLRMLLRDGALSDDKNGHIYVLEPSEWRDAIALLTVPILYGWDAHLLFASAAALVNVSHEGSISASINVSYSEEQRRLRAWQSGRVAESGRSAKDIAP